MLQKLDDWVLNKVYQKIVDFVGKQPRWFVEQCAFIVLIMGIFRNFYSPEISVFFLILDIIVVTLFLSCSRSEARLRYLGDSQGFRLVMVSLSFYTILTALITFEMPKSILAIVYNAAFASVYYFAACKPPPPPKENRKIAFQV